MCLWWRSAPCCGVCASPCPCPRAAADHRAACARSGALRSRGCPLERAAARVCREAGARVICNTRVRDLNVASHVLSLCRRHGAEKRPLTPSLLATPVAALWLPGLKLGAAGALRPQSLCACWPTPKLALPQPCCGLLCAAPLVWLARRGCIPSFCRELDLPAVAWP